MSEERRRIIEGTWKCGECGQEGIEGRLKKCPACGSPREDREMKFDFGERSASGASTKEAVQDETLKAAAAAGADWHCAYCESGNSNSDAKCKVCGAERSEKKKKEEKPPEPTPAPKEEPKAEEAKTGSKAGCGCGGLGCVGMGVAGVVGALLIAVLIMMFWKTEEAGQITGMSWERTIAHERFTLLTKQEWESSIPKNKSKMPVEGKGERAGADNVRDCERKEKSPKGCETKTRSVQCGTEEKCEVKDLGNGFAEEVCKDVPKYCDEKYEDCHEAVFDNWCTYDTYEWKSVDTYKAGGDGRDVKWPDAPKPQALDRLEKRESYKIDVKYAKGKKNTYEPASESEFLKWEDGQKVVVVVNGLGAVTELKPKK